MNEDARSRDYSHYADIVLRRQKVHAVPLRKTDKSVEEDLQHEAWKDLLSSWKSRVSCLSYEIVHLTADIRLSPLVEKIRCDSPVDANNNPATGPSLTPIILQLIEIKHTPGTLQNLHITDLVQFKYFVLGVRGGSMGAGCLAAHYWVKKFRSGGKIRHATQWAKSDLNED